MLQKISPIKSSSVEYKAKRVQRFIWTTRGSSLRGFMHHLINSEATAFCTLIISIYIYIKINVSIYIYINKYINKCVYIYKCIYIYIYTVNPYLKHFVHWLYPFIYIYIYINKCMYIYINPYIVGLAVTLWPLKFFPSRNNVSIVRIRKTGYRAGRG